VTATAGWREGLLEGERAAVIHAMGAFLRAPIQEAVAKKRKLDQEWADYDAAVLRRKP
jgi:hypothetical protein